MESKNTHPESLMEAVTFFSDKHVCHDYMTRIKWPDGCVTCPQCKSKNIGEIKTRCMFKCRDCKKQFSTKVGTIFEDSPLSLQKWFVAVWCIANAKNGISSCELARAIKVTQKTAWFMLHRIRLAMKTQSFTKRIKGEIEGDETFIGGKMRNMHKSKRAALPKGRGTVGKAIVQGLIERGGEVRVRVVKDQRRSTLQPIIREHVEPGSAVYTDALKSYEGLSDDYVHAVVDHAVEYVNGRVHTNCMENFWSLLKRALMGTYVAVRPEHLDAYLDEQMMRFNARNGDDAGRFRQVMGNVSGRRVTYRELTA
ncbi:IS1595 family transposase [Planctomycetales bacterium ZRK34]|nr:IS1595 family transposase [Planctomycetales bacterium ZRK34]